MTLCGMAADVTRAVQPPHRPGDVGTTEYEIQYRNLPSAPMASAGWVTFRHYDMESEMLEGYPVLRRALPSYIELRMARVVPYSMALYKALTDGANGGMLKNESVPTLMDDADETLGDGDTTLATMDAHGGIPEPVTEDDWGDV